MSKGFTIKEVRPRIFFLNFKRHYDMCMYFMRYQEHYESPSTKFRNKAFTIIDFMDWYSEKFGGGAFTYPVDWSGFNIPGHTIKTVRKLGIPDFNRYDYYMFEAWEKCVKHYPDEKFYIIGAVGEHGALKHEIAHGLFYTQPEYKKEMTKLVKALKPRTKEKMFKTLKDIGYTPKVFIDECQAYMATGLPDGFKLNGYLYLKPFEELFNKYYL